MALQRPFAYVCGSLVIAAGFLVGTVRETRTPSPTPAAPRFRAVAFDYFVLFNPDSIIATAEAIYPGRGRELTLLWRTRQFEYSWLRSITNRYEDFFRVSDEALVFACHTLHLDLDAESKRRLLEAYLSLTPWPDTAHALGRLRSSGVRVITIANFSPHMLQANADRAGLTALFDQLVL